MKKLLVLLFVTLISVNGFAQKGRHAIGISVGENALLCYDGNLFNSFGLSSKYQYGITNIFRR